MLNSVALMEGIENLLAFLCWIGLKIALLIDKLLKLLSDERLDREFNGSKLDDCLIHTLALNIIIHFQKFLFNFSICSRWLVLKHLSSEILYEVQRTNEILAGNI